MLPKAEADFFRHKVQMWLLLRHVQRARCGAPGPPVPPLAPPAREAQVGAVLPDFERRVVCAPRPPCPLPFVLIGHVASLTPY